MRFMDDNEIKEMKRLQRKWMWLNVWDITRMVISILGLIGSIIGLIVVICK